MTTAAVKGEFSLMWNFSEDEFITPADEEEDDEDEDEDKTDASSKKVSEGKKDS